MQEYINAYTGHFRKQKVKLKISIKEIKMK